MSQAGFRSMVLIEALCWGGLLFFFWTLRSKSSHIPPGRERSAAAPSAKTDKSRHIPQSFSEPIGIYRDIPIHRYVVINGWTYQFDHVHIEDIDEQLRENERCIAPGLIYVKC